jgi:TolA-binding protein
MLALGNAQEGLFMVVIVLCATTVMLMLLRRRQFRTATGRDLAREQMARLRDQRDIRSSMDELMLQLEDLQRRVSAQLDTKFVRLETVIRDADDRIARLQAVSTGQAAPQTPSLSTRSAPPTLAVRERPKPQDRHDGAGACGAEPPTAAPAPALPAAPLSAEHKRVYDKIDAGASPLQVAEQLGMTLGEVELIINLRGM